MKKWMMASSMLLLLVACSDEEVGQANSAAPTENVESAEQAIDNSKENLPQIFDEGTFVADNMVMGFPADVSEKVNAIVAKMEQGIVENEAWYSETIGSLAEGEQLPYDERIGVTEEEYNYFMESEQYMTLGKVGENELTISKEAEQATIQIANGSILNEITISADGNALQTNLGELSYSSEIIASDEQLVTGRWSGHVYQLGRDGTQQVVQISLGRLEGNNKKIIYIKFYKQGEELKDEILIFD